MIKLFLLPKSHFYTASFIKLHLHGLTTGKITPVIDHSYDFFFFHKKKSLVITTLSDVKFQIQKNPWIFLLMSCTHQIMSSFSEEEIEN